MRPAIIVAVLGSVFGVGSARADMTLTAAGTAQGFSLSTFASGFPVYGGNNAGPLGIAFTNGGVLVTDEPGDVRLFPTDADGQNANNVPVIQNYGAGNAEGLLGTGSAIYMTQYVNGWVVQLNSDGTFQRNIAMFASPAGIVPDPVNGHLFVSSFDNSQIMDVDPSTGVATVFASASHPDGLALSADGRTLYAAAAGTGTIDGFDTTTGAQVYISNSILGGTVDGLILGAGNLSGQLFVNTNGGELIDVNLATNAQTVIASGGSRGDFLTLDPSNGTLMITQTDSVLRLSGGTFVPEPASIGVVAMAGSLVLPARRRFK